VSDLPRALTLGTAGHIDHGKTRLVQALTGIDTDRLPEEKRRGISIALGYAELRLPDGTRLSVVDVPGHERFVRTMVAGATGIDLFLLAVDAGEGPKPQTLEHLEILSLLGVESGVVALTKIDAVDPERAAVSEAAVRELIPGHEIVRVSAIDGTGLPELVEALERVAGAVEMRRSEGPVRLYVDRSFSLPGAGRIVTGTLWSGTISAGARLTVLPSGYGVRVRSVEVHGQPADVALPGQRVALAVTADRQQRPQPGDAIVAPGAFVPSYRLDVSLERAPAVADGFPVTVCHGTSAVPARVVRRGDRFAQLRLSRPVVAARSDRIVLRRETTVGGARVLDPSPPRRPDLRRLELLEGSEPSVLVKALLDSPVETREARVRLGLEAEELSGLDGVVPAGDWLFSTDWLDGARARARAALEAREGALDPGLTAAELLGAEPWAPVVARYLELDARDGRLYLPGRERGTRGRGAELVERIAESGLEPVEVGDPELARELEREGQLVRLGDRLAIGPAAYSRYRELLGEEWDEAGTVTLAGFRDRAGISRRVAQLVLERFDADRVTLRVGDERRLRRGSRRD
jgi:selenocysteine-specific elongation factor